VIAPDTPSPVLPGHDPEITADSSRSQEDGLTRLLRFWVSDRLLLWGVAGFLAGYFVMWNVELQLMWLVAVCLPAGISVCRRTRGAGMAGESMLRLAAAFLTWNLAAGIIRNPEAFADYYTFEFVAGAVLLPVFLGTLWLVCRSGRGARCLLRIVVWSAFGAALAAIGWWYFVLSEDEPGARLRNPLVHGGLHPVATAITLGFGGLSAAAAYGRAATRGCRWILLGVLAVICLAVMLTLSRGALVALACGFTALLCACGWRKAWPPVLTAAAVTVAFQFLAGALTPLNFAGEPATGGSAPPASPLAVLTDSPAREYLARGDSGRLNFYRYGMANLDQWDKHLTGAGLWGPEQKLKEVTSGQIDHFHSLFVATYVHGGVIGSAMLLGLIGLGLRRAWTLSRAGEPQWFALLAYGLGGLLFDGQSACSLVTHPRFENLILWFPLVAIAAAWRNGRDRHAGRQPSSSASR